jgi:hypothetical protein
LTDIDRLSHGQSVGCDPRRYVLRHRTALVRGQVQAGFSAPINNVFGRARPFMLDQVVNFPREKFGPEIGAEIAHCARIRHNFGHCRAVAARKGTANAIR